MRPISEFYSYLDSPRNVAITMHQKPDADALGSSLGLKAVLEKIGPPRNHCIANKLAGIFKLDSRMFKVIDFESKREVGERAVLGADVVFCLDFNDLKRTKTLKLFRKNHGYTGVD